ncbi:MAG: hypothetical protein LPK49_07805, partial [Bacteroidota bacterium]|nr:hypothetical protein [Bacteroidota bacterium]MDX5430931.1 hypothetical protein [Bacteroidota bacterium]
MTLLLLMGLRPAESPDQLIWTEPFDDASPKWRTSNSPDELYLIQGGHYVLHRKASTGPSIILPEEGDLYGESRVEMELTLDANVAGSSLGMMFLAKPNGKSAYMIEINDQREYRIRQIESSIFKEMSGTAKSSGWVKEKAIAKAGTKNRLAATYESGVLKFEINGKDLWVGDVFQPEKGKVGIYVGPGSKGFVDAIRVYVSEEEASRIRKDREDKDPVRAELTDIIISLRNTINAQNKEIDSLTKMSSKLQAELSKIDNSPRNVKKLSAEVAQLTKENKSLEWQLKKEKKEVDRLTKFQNTIRAKQGG